MPRYEIRNTANDALSYVEGVLPLDLAALLPNGTYRARVMSDEEPTNIVINTTVDISNLSPVDGATGVTTTANLVMTFNRAMARQGTVDLRNVGGALIESFDLATEGVWSAGDTVWTGDPADAFASSASLCVRWSGLQDTLGNTIADNTGDTAWNFTVEAAAPSGGLTLLTQSVSDGTFAANKDFSVSGTAGDTVAMFLCYGGAITALNSVTIDPGGPNETVATIRLARTEGNTSIALADAVWPATGSLTVRSNWAANIGVTGITALSAGAKTYQAGVHGTSAGKVAPQNHTLSINTTAGDSVLLGAVLVSSGAAVSASVGVDEVVGTLMGLAGTRDGYVTKVDSAAGGSPETFEMQWASLSFAATQGLVGVYR